MIEYDKLDPGVRDMVQYFNEQGLETLMSCEGHYPEEQRMALFWISFAPHITQQDIQNFMKRHLNKYHHFTSAGHFVKRFYIYDGDKPREQFMYEVGCKGAADLDLQTWKEDDKCYTHTQAQ